MLFKARSLLFLQTVERSLQLTWYQGCIIIIINENLLFSLSQSNGRIFRCPPGSLREIAVHLEQDHKWPWGRGWDVGFVEKVNLCVARRTLNSGHLIGFRIDQSNVSNTKIVSLRRQIRSEKENITCVLRFPCIVCGKLMVSSKLKRVLLKKD